MTRSRAASSWSDVFPGLVPVTVLMPAAEARRVLRTARGDGRLVGERTVLADGGDAGTESRETAAKTTMPPPAPVTAAPVETDASRPSHVARVRTPARQSPRLLNGGRRERPSILDERPPRQELQPAEPKRRFNAARGCWETRGEVTADDLAMAADAVASGAVKVTRCPPMTFSTPAGAPDPAVAAQMKRRERHRRG